MREERNYQPFVTDFHVHIQMLISKNLGEICLLVYGFVGKVGLKV